MPDHRADSLIPRDLAYDGGDYLPGDERPTSQTQEPPGRFREDMHTHLDGILKARGERYGAFSDNAAVAQAIKQAVRMGRRYNEWDDDMKECADQLASKLSRAATGDPRYADNWEDMANFPRMVAERLRGGRD